jgi:hypothetical protein
MLSDEMMIASVKSRFDAMSEDARATLECAFRDGIERPFMTSEYSSFRRKVCGVPIEFHWFCIGFCCFLIATAPCGRHIVCGMTLRDGFPLYPVNR